MRTTLLAEKIDEPHAFFEKAGLGEQKVMKLRHEAIVERRKILETIGTGFFEAFKKENLMTWVKLFQ